MLSKTLTVIAAVLMFLIPAMLFSQTEDADSPDEEESARTYRTREERRKAGLKYSLNEQITLSGLLEGEYLYQSEPLEDESSATIQLGLEATPFLTGDDRVPTTSSMFRKFFSTTKLELVYEYDAVANEQLLDEAIVSLEVRPFDVEAGLVNTPFGEYFSHFVTGPFLEFGETRNIGAVLSYTPEDRFDLSAFIYKGDAQQIETGSGSWSWGFSFEYSPFPSGTFALSYQSDIADSEVGLLNDFEDRYIKRVSGLSGYVLLGRGSFEITGEFVQSLGSFEELDPDHDQPGAWNVEVAYYPTRAIELALRCEGSTELEDGARFRAGFGGTWRLLKNVYFSAEYLHSRPEDSENAHHFAARISIL